MLDVSLCAFGPLTNFLPGRLDKKGGTLGQTCIHRQCRCITFHVCCNFIFMCFYIDMCTFLEAHLFLQSCCQTKAIMENSFICWSNKTRTTIRYETVDVLVHSTAARVEPVQPQSWCWHEADTGSKWTLLHNNLKNVEFRKKKSISTKCFFLHLFHQQINYCVFNMTDFLYVLWYSTDFAGAVLIQTNIASIQSFLRPGLYVFAEPYCLLSANMCSSFQENSRPWSQCISKILGYITYK